MARAAGVSLARSLAGSWLADSKCRRRAKAKGQRHGSWRSRIRVRFGNDDSVAYRRGRETKKGSHGTFTFFLSWVGLVLSWKKLGGLERRKGRCHVGWRTSRIISQMEAGPFEAFLFCAGVGVDEGTVCFGIVVVMNERKVPCVMKTR